MDQNTNGPIYRILDANLNRLREALRVIEEHFRFVCESTEISTRLKTLRHSLQSAEQSIGRDRLLAFRDTKSDPFSKGNRPEEMLRENILDVLYANLKRGQEASRVIEEYAKVVGASDCCDMAKSIRFTLYALEKDVGYTP